MIAWANQPSLRSQVKSRNEYSFLRASGTNSETLDTKTC